MWYVSGCPVCGYSEHTPRPADRCPNDGEKLIRLEGRTVAWRRLEIAHRTVRDAIESARKIAQEVPW